ncbi:DUF5954 family protein [Streptomyces stramineus]|uniref:Transposase n=1 Tax=Streptomyces stramineus TaxID=173861 RepID=A0ABN0ZEF7_9ACTN
MPTERANQLKAGGTVHQNCRARRLLRRGPDGPGNPRPSDTNSHPLSQLHPSLDEESTVHYSHENDEA